MALTRITFHLTDRCQLNCDHCLRDPEAKPVDLELSLIESVLDQARSAFGSNHVGLTGGEPTLHPEFYAVVDAIVDRGFSWHVVSNGSRFDQVLERLSARPERLAGLEVVNFSLDGATEEVHDSIREQGSFRAVMRAASLCKARGVPFLFLSALNARNVDQLEELALLASQLGAASVTYSSTQPTGTFLDPSLHLPASEWRRALDRVHRAAGTFRIPIATGPTVPHDEPFKLCVVFQHEGLHVDHHGRLTLCCHHSGVPSEGPRSDVVADLHHVPLIEAHRRFAELVHETVRARLARLAAPDLDEWDRHFSCNWCLGHFGRPRWSDAGVVGPDASRVRWRGRWTPGYKPSHRLVVIPDDPPRDEEGR